MPIAALDRAVFRLSGEGVSAWLDGLITNSISQNGLSFAALLTPQGKIIADFFIMPASVQNGAKDVLWLETPRKFAADLFKRLRMYKLRAPIIIEDMSESHKVYALWSISEGDDDMPFALNTGFDPLADPRQPALGRRLIADRDLEIAAADSGDYNAHRLSLGMTESQWDFETASRFPADTNMDLVNGVDFKKGCFIGQEVVSRMKRMTQVKKRFRALVLDVPAKTGDKIMAAERVIGETVSVHGTMAMAMIRLDRLRAAQDAPAIDGAPVRIMAGPDGQ